MSLEYPNLFSPKTIRGYTFRNRIVTAPTGLWSFSPDSAMLDYCISHYEDLAKGGAAAVTLGDTDINVGHPHVTAMGDYFPLRGSKARGALAEVAAAIRQNGAHASVQLNHHGELDLNDLTMDEIQGIINRFAECAAALKTAGFNMCMLHGAHGWLLGRFVSTIENHRTDKYGQDRTLFAKEVIAAIRDACGNDFLIEYRISGVDFTEGGMSQDDIVDYVRAIEKGIDLLHVSAGKVGNLEYMKSMFPIYLAERGLNVKYAEYIKRRVSVPVVTVGAITDLDMAEEIIASGKADFVAMARNLIADPQLPNKARRGQSDQIIPCLNCYQCLDEMHKSGYFGCRVNPRSGREHRLTEISRAITKKRICVIGGGPAGMQAAITAGQRGHDVVLFEKNSELGGLLKVSDSDRNKALLKKYKNYLIRMTEKLQVDVRLNTEATPELVDEICPDAIIIATGSLPFIPNISGVDESSVMTAVEAHVPGKVIGDRVVIVGGNMVGCETALYMKEMGKTVSVIEMTDKIAADANNFIMMELAGRLSRDFSCYTNAECKEIKNDGVIIKSSDAIKFIPADTVILAVGMRSNKSIASELRSRYADVIEVGDCIRPANVSQASRTAYFAAREL